MSIAPEGREASFAAMSAAPIFVAKVRPYLIYYPAPI
jgi:hypothetical protein